jgi:hypothetical protein
MGPDPTHIAPRLRNALEALNAEGPLRGRLDNALSQTRPLRPVDLPKSLRTEFKAAQAWAVPLSRATSAEVTRMAAELRSLIERALAIVEPR